MNDNKQLCWFTFTSIVVMALLMGWNAQAGNVHSVRKEGTALIVNGRDGSTETYGDPTKMSNELAIKMGRKIYTDADVTLTGTGWVAYANHTVFIPYQMQDGTWRLKFNVGGVWTSTTDFALTVSGISTPVTGSAQPITAILGGSGVYVYGFIVTNTNIFRLVAGSAQTSGSWSGDIILSARPTWAI